MLRYLADFLNKRASVGGTLSPEDIALARRHQVAGILYYQTRDSRLLEDYSYTVAMYARRRRAVADVASLLSACGIPFYQVKGLAAAENYPVPALRSMGDCDLVVRSEDRESVRAVLEGLGFVNESAQDDHEWAYSKNGMEFEIHDGLLYYDAINSPAEHRLMARHWEYVKDGALDSAFHFVYLLVHLKKHFLYEGVGFRQFLDVAAAAMYGNLDWERVSDLLSSAGLTRFAGVCLGLCARWFDAAVPFQTELSEEFLREATSKIEANGVFGFDDASNRENNCLNRVRRNGRFHSVLRSLFPRYEDMRYVAYYSWVNGRRGLLPAAWVYRYLRLLGHRETRENGMTDLRRIAATDLTEREKTLSAWGL